MPTPVQPRFQPLARQVVGLDRDDAVSMRVADGVACTVIEDEAVLLHLGTGRYYRLNRSGTCAWQTLTEGGGAHQAAAAVTARFAVDEETALADVSRLVRDLCDTGLLETDHE